MSAAPTPVAPPALSACDACLRRTRLLELLAGHIERARSDGKHLPELLALSDDRLLRALAGRRRGEIELQLGRFAPAAAREAITAARLVALCRHDPSYPVCLTTMPDAPAVLHVAGDPAELLAAGDDIEPCAAAVVGARRATEYGLEVARELGRELGAAGVRVVSGLALGIDSAAHTGALAGGGATVAVLAGSAEVAYPASKRRLYAEIVRRCCVVSEMPPGYRPYRWNFPARNRIIAGLAAVTVVVEAAARSGSLITAELAMGLGRAVGAVPGPVLGERSAGTNGLLHDGAHVVRGAQDVLDVLLAHGFTTPALVPAGRAAPPEPELAALLDHVDAGRATPGAVAAATGDLTAATVGLARLELLGHVRRVPGGRYVRTA